MWNTATKMCRFNFGALIHRRASIGFQQDDLVKVAKVVTVMNILKEEFKSTGVDGWSLTNSLNAF